MQAQPIENVRNNVFQLEIVKKSKQNSKMKTDGAEKQTPNNNSVDRWVHTIREKSDVKKCIDYLYEKALSATNLDTQRAACLAWLYGSLLINHLLCRCDHSSFSFK